MVSDGVFHDRCRGGLARCRLSNCARTKMLMIAQFHQGTNSGIFVSLRTGSPWTGHCRNVGDVTLETSVVSTVTQQVLSEFIPTLEPWQSGRLLYAVHSEHNRNTFMRIFWRMQKSPSSGSTHCPTTISSVSKTWLHADLAHRNTGW
jgi:hypothetical protein